MRLIQERCARKKGDFITDPLGSLVRKNFEKMQGGKNMMSERSKSAMSATLERFELLARGSPQVTSLS